METNNEANHPSEIVETHDFLAQVQESFDIIRWDELRRGVDFVATSLTFYGSIRPRNDGLRYVDMLDGDFSIGCEIPGDGGPVIYREFK